MTLKELYENVNEKYEPKFDGMPEAIAVFASFLGWDHIIREGDKEYSKLAISILINSDYHQSNEYIELVYRKACETIQFFK